MKLYIYDKNTSELIGSTEAHLDPLESLRLQSEVYVIPPFCTPLIPLQEEGNLINVFNKEKGMWELVEDNRGIEVYDKKGNSLKITSLGSIPEGYLREKKLSLQEEKLNLVALVDTAYAESFSELIKVGSITDNIEARVKLEALKQFMGDNELGTYYLADGSPVILDSSEVSYLSRYFYVRSLFLPVRRNEILKKVKTAKNKKQLEDIKIDFDIRKETEKLLKKSDEEISKYIKESLK